VRSADDPERLILVVGHQHRRGAGPAEDLLDVGADAGPQVRVQRRERLVPQPASSPQAATEPTARTRTGRRFVRWRSGWMEPCVVLVLLVISLPWDHFSMIWSPPARDT
jgi:hypothetical protein